VAAHALPAAIAEDAYLNGPGIVATGDAFMLAYREQRVASASSKSRLVVLTLHDDGVLDAPVYLTSNYFDNTCAGKTIADDGVGIGWNDARSAGLIAVSHPSCAGASTSGPIFVGIANGTTSDESVVKGAGDSFSLARVHAVAAAVTASADQPDAAVPGDFLLVSTADNTPTEAVIPLASLTIPTAGPILSQTGSFVAQVASSGSLAGELLMGTPDGKGPSTTLVLKGAGAAPIIDDSLPVASTGAITVFDSTALAALATPSGLGWVARDVSSPGTFTPIDPATAEAGTDTTYGAIDVATVGDHVVIAAGTPGRLELARLDGAKVAALTSAGTILDTGTSSLWSELLASFDGEHFAIAAARGLVAVSWLSEHKLRGGVPTGGYALLRCR
jgi:hypothetical protein